MKKNSTSISARPKQKGPAGLKKTDVKTTAKLTVGIDLGDQKSAYCILDTDGSVLSEGAIRTSESGFAQQFQSMAHCRIALETGTHSPWVSRQIENYGHDVIVANSRQVRLIYESDRKNDKVDARTLARLARIDKDLLHPIRHRGEKAQADLTMLRARDTLVQVRTKLINCARGMVKSVGGRLPSASGDYFARKSREHIPEAIRDALTPVLDQIEQVTTQLREYHKQIEKMAETDYSQTALMRQIPGVGVITSMAFTLTIDDPHRFRKSRDIAGYLGLLPRQSDSGESHPSVADHQGWRSHVAAPVGWQCAIHPGAFWARHRLAPLGAEFDGARGQERQEEGGCGCCSETGRTDAQAMDHR